MPWKKGQSGNPGGKTSEQKRLEQANAERASRIRERLLVALDEATQDQALKSLSSEVLKLLKDSEDRGLGAPKQEVEQKTTITEIEVQVVEHQSGAED